VNIFGDFWVQCKVGYDVRIYGKVGYIVRFLF
jgi:hypothetical protein